MSVGVQNLFNIIKACENTDGYNSLLNDYHAGTLKYKDLKDVTAESLVKITTPLRLKERNY